MYLAFGICGILSGLLTAPVMTLLGMSLRAIKPDWFYDLPGIVMPSLGVGCVGLLAVLSMIG